MEGLKKIREKRGRKEKVEIFEKWNDEVECVKLDMEDKM